MFQKTQGLTCSEWLNQICIFSKEEILNVLVSLWKWGFCQRRTECTERVAVWRTEPREGQSVSRVGRAVSRLEDEQSRGTGAGQRAGQPERPAGRRMSWGGGWGGRRWRWAGGGGWGGRRWRWAGEEAEEAGGGDELGRRLRRQEVEMSWGGGWGGRRWRGAGEEAEEAGGGVELIMERFALCWVERGNMQIQVTTLNIMNLKFTHREVLWLFLIKVTFNYQMISSSVLSSSVLSSSVLSSSALSSSALSSSVLHRPTRDSEDDEDDERKGKGCTLQVSCDWYSYHI